MRFLGRMALLVMLCSFAGLVHATMRGAPLIVGDDRGGMLLDRVQQVRALKNAVTVVEIRGDICLSTCTLFLGLPTVCILPNTVFGFHGPSYSGRPLPPALFQRASHIIATHYPDPVRDWYLTKARHTLDGIERLSGQALIDMGVPRCRDGPPADGKPHFDLAS